MSARRLALLALAAAPVAGAWAMASVYECPDGSQLKVSYTPKLAQVEHGGKHWTLTRLRAAGAAQYAGSGASLVTQRSEAILHKPGGELRCTLQRSSGTEKF